MKKIISILLVMMLVVSLIACGKKANNEAETNNETQIENQVDTNKDAEDGNAAVDQPEKAPAEDDKIANDSKPSNNETKPSAKPAEKPVETPAEKPAETPAEKPVETPEQKPEEKPQENTPQTIGNILLADFKANASMDVQALAKKLISNPAITFSGDAAPVSEGYLTGFGNAEIKGFKNASMFIPMIGSIPFVGYVFELEDASSVDSFISTLKDNADLRWNICVAADEMVTGSVGNKVFFVMCPTSLEG